MTFHQVSSDSLVSAGSILTRVARVTLAFRRVGDRLKSACEMGQASLSHIRQKLSLLFLFLRFRHGKPFEKMKLGIVLIRKTILMLLIHLPLPLLSSAKSYQLIRAVYSFVTIAISRSYLHPFCCRLSFQRVILCHIDNGACARAVVSLAQFFFFFLL